MSRATLVMSQADYEADGLQTPAEVVEGFFPPTPTEAVPAVEVVPPVEDPLDHTQLGVRTEKGSQPWCIDHYLLMNVGIPRTMEEIAVGSGVNLKKVKIHIHYWSGVDQVIGKNGWTAKRAASGLCQRMRIAGGKAYLAPKE